MTTYDKIVELIDQYAKEDTDGTAILFIGVKRLSEKKGECSSTQLIPKNDGEGCMISESVCSLEATDMAMSIASIATVICSEKPEFYEALVHAVKKYSLLRRNGNIVN